MTGFWSDQLSSTPLSSGKIKSYLQLPSPGCIGMRLVSPFCRQVQILLVPQACCSYIVMNRWRVALFPCWSFQLLLHPAAWQLWALILHTSQTWGNAAAMSNLRLFPLPSSGFSYPVMPLSWHFAIFGSFRHCLHSPSAFSLHGALCFPCSMRSALLLRFPGKAQGLSLLSPLLTTVVSTPVHAEITPKQLEMCRWKHSFSSFSPCRQFGLISPRLALGRWPGTSNEGILWLSGPWARLKAFIRYFSISSGGEKYTPLCHWCEALGCWRERFWW